MVLAITVSISSCKKKDSTTNQTAPQNTTPTASTPSNADGAFAAVKTLTVSSYAGYNTTINVGTAVSWFGTQNSYVDGGTVKCNNNTLSKQSNNAYIFTPAQTSPTGIDFSGDVSWDISGNSSNAVPPFTKTDAGVFPSVDGISQTDDVSTSSAFTLSASSSVIGDSVMFVVAGPNGHVLKTKGPNTSSCDFTAAEMGTLGTGSNVGLLQIAPYTIHYDNTAAPGKNYYFVKETVVSKIVNLK